MFTTEKLFEKINGTYFGIIGLFSSALTMVIAIIVYLVKDPSFFVTTNFISDLSVGPNGADTFFTVSIILMGLFFIPFFYFIRVCLIGQGGSKKLLDLGFIFFLIYGISSIVLSFFPLDASNKQLYNTHMMVAIVLFASAGIGMVFYGFVEYQSNLPKYLVINSFLVAFFTGFFADLLILGNYTSFYAFDSLIYIVEWTAFLLFVIWHSLHIKLTYNLSYK